MLLNPLTPVQALAFVSDLTLSSLIKICPYPYSSSVGGKDLSNDTQIRVIGAMEHEICTKMLRHLSEKLAAKFPATTPSYSMVKIALLDNAFLEILELEASPVEGQSPPQKR